MGPVISLERGVFGQRPSRYGDQLGRDITGISGKLEGWGSYSLMWAKVLASPFFISRLPWRAIMMRWAWGEPAPCMDSVR